MGAKPLISVIMCCYNEDVRWIMASVSSILNQTFREFEFIVVVDEPNNSEVIDLLMEFSLSDQRMYVTVNNANMGVVWSRNRAIDLARGQYIAVMDADDISHESRLETQLAYMIKNRDVDLLGTNVITISQNGNASGRRRSIPTDYEHVKKILPFTNFFNHSTLLVKKRVYDRLNGYRNIPRSEDYDFLLRALTNKFNLQNINEYLVQYRIREGSISRARPFVQYISTLYSKKLYKERSRSNCDLDNFGDGDYQCYLTSHYDAQAEERYCVAERRFNECLNNFTKKRYLTGALNLAQSVLGGELHHRKSLDLLRYTLTCLALLTR